MGGGGRGGRAGDDDTFNFKRNQKVCDTQESEKSSLSLLAR